MVHKGKAPKAGPQPAAGRVSKYTVEMPQEVYLKLKFFLAAESVKQNRHVSMNEVIVRFIREGLRDFDPSQVLKEEEGAKNGSGE
ncbi:MAG: hypothetical protein ACLFUU_12900 [Desulfobacteraceae bacterium]